MLYYSGLSRTLRQLRWVLYPRRCPFCDRVLGSRPACPDCTDGLAELRRAPSMRLRGSEHYLGRLDGAAAPYRYTGLVRRAVLRAKYQGAPWAAVELGVEMARLLFGSEIRMAALSPCPNRYRALTGVTIASFRYRPPAKSAATMCRSGWHSPLPGRWACRWSRTC